MMNDKARQRPSSVRKPEKGKFYVFGPDLHTAQHDIELTNEEALIWPGEFIAVGPRRVPGKPGYPATPRLGFKSSARKHKLPRDLDVVSAIWIVSERLKQIFESVDPEGFAFAACDFTLPDGSKGPQFYLCDVTRTLDALDEEASKMNPPIFDADFNTGEKVKIYDLAGTPSLSFKEEVVGESHVFRTPFIGTVFCDRVLRDACKAAGLGQKDGLKGIMFDDAADL